MKRKRAAEPEYFTFVDAADDAWGNLAVQAEDAAAGEDLVVQAEPEHDAIADTVAELVLVRALFPDIAIEELNAAAAVADVVPAAEETAAVAQRVAEVGENLAVGIHQQQQLVSAQQAATAAAAAADVVPVEVAQRGGEQPAVAENLAVAHPEQLVAADVPDFSQLPDDIWYEILGHLDARDLARFQAVNYTLALMAWELSFKEYLSRPSRADEENLAREMIEKMEAGENFRETVDRLELAGWENDVEEFVEHFVEFDFLRGTYVNGPDPRWTRELLEELLSDPKVYAD